MSQPQRVAGTTAFVLGAGFTKALLPDAPLLTDDYGAAALRDKFAGFPRAIEILDNERRLSGDLINVERLLTRLDEGMPFDFARGGEAELRLLRSEVLAAFVARIEAARRGIVNSVELNKFARYCVTGGHHCVTFNHDDVFDEALWKVQSTNVTMSVPYWHPDGGYGFFCTPSASCIGTVNTSMDFSSMLLLKLHGSTNWFPRRGYLRPLAVDAVVHYETWLPIEVPAPPPSLPPNVRIIFPQPPQTMFQLPSPQLLQAIKLHLEADAFIVPPVLMKASLVHEPLLRLVWSATLDMLRVVERVVFIGYSMPTTDLAARFLFSEALGDLPLDRIEIVNNTSTPEELLRSYEAVFPELPSSALNGVDALDWIRQLAVPAEQLPLVAGAQAEPDGLVLGGSGQAGAPLT